MREDLLMYGIVYTVKGGDVNKIFSSDKAVFCKIGLFTEWNCKFRKHGSKFFYFEEITLFFTIL